MGFFKDLKNKVTGGAVTVTVTVPPVRRGQAAQVTVQATAKANAKVSSVYLLVRATESCEVKDTDTVDGKSRTETVRGRHTSYETRLQVAGSQELKEGQSYTWQTQLELPTSALPSLNGKIIDHEWEAQAGLDMTGNDPDSGWQSFQVS
jgi:hypothetical protein